MSGVAAGGLYSTLVGSFVNDAKKQVEDAWQWADLRQMITVSVTTGNAGPYPLASYLNERAVLWMQPPTGQPLVRCTTAGFEGQDMTQVNETYQFAAKQTFGNNFPSLYYLTSDNNSATAGQSRLQLNFVTPPNSTYTFQMVFKNSQNELTNDTDVFYVPSEPCKELAYLFCLYERGEELGEQLTFTEDKASKYLADAIQLDLARQNIDLSFGTTNHTNT